MKNTATETDVIDIFGDNLNNMLSYRRMKPSELARATGIQKSTVSRLISKECMPTLKTVMNICYVLDCDFEDLIPSGIMII